VSADDERHMQEALAVAEQGLEHRELPIGAVIVVDGDVVASAYTQERTQRRLLVHAELLALDQADRVLEHQRRQATLYTTLEPCLGCLGAAMTVGVGRIVFALESPTDGAAQFAVEWDRQRTRQDLPGYQLPVIQGGVRRDESRQLFARFAAQTGHNDGLVTWAHTLARL
jgi:tRNA(adenine34) deaminase